MFPVNNAAFHAEGSALPACLKFPENPAIAAASFISNTFNNIHFPWTYRTKEEMRWFFAVDRDHAGEN